MSQETTGKIIGIVLTAVVALLSVFGYDVVVVQPREQEAHVMMAEAAGIEVPAP